MSDDGFLRGYDDWKTTEPPEQPSTIHRYRCLDCPWRGTDAYLHHRVAHHRIVLRDAPHWGVIYFTCCPEVRP